MANDEQALFDHQKGEHERDLGWIGRCFGGRSEKPGNISAFVIVVCFAIIAALIFILIESDKFEKVFAGLLSVITLVLGYLFGSNDGRK